jgi:hypothetical protein
MKPPIARMVRQLAMTVLLGPLFSLPPPGQCDPVRGLPDAADVMRRVMEHVQAVAAKDGPQYTYQSCKVLERLKGSGEIVESEERDYRVNLIAGYPIHHLTRIQGQSLSPEELKQEGQKEIRFRQKFTSLNMEKLAAHRTTWLTSNLLARYEFTVTGRITISNRPTLVVVFRPKAGDLPVVDVQDRLLNLLAGTVWIDEQDADAVKLSVGLADTLSLGWFGILGSLSECNLTLERLRLPDGVWVISKQTLQLQLRKLASTKRYRITEESSGYQRVVRKAVESAAQANAR